MATQDLAAREARRIAKAEKAKARRRVTAPESGAARRERAPAADAASVLVKAAERQRRESVRRERVEQLARKQEQRRAAVAARELAKAAQRKRIETEQRDRAERTATRAVEPKTPPSISTKAPARAERQALWQAIGQATPIIQATSEGVQYFLYTHDQGISQRIFLDGVYAVDGMDRALAILERLVGSIRDRVFVDIGANIGTVCLRALSVLGFQRALAIEAAPANVRLLLLNRDWNGLSDRLAVVHAAVGDVEGEAQLELNERSLGGHSVAVKDRHPGRLITVPATTLDAILQRQGLTPVDLGLVWMDVQGFEGYVLEGARHVVAAGVPLYVELWPKGLKRKNGYDLLLGALQEHYTSFYPVTKGGTGKELAIAQLPAFAASIEERGGFTDILVVRKR